MTNPNDPATGYGIAGTADGWQSWSTDGLTKREYFAGLALQGLLACTDIEGSDENISKSAVAFADALIAALNATDTPK